LRLCDSLHSQSNTFVCILGEFTPNNSHGLVTSPLNESQQSDGRWPISLQGCYEWRASKLKTAYDPISHKFLREFPEFLKFIDANWINVIDIARIAHLLMYMLLKCCVVM